MNDKISILIVEDDPNLGLLLKEYLELKGFQASLEANGEDGWKTACRQEHDLLIIDVMLPRKDGFTLMKELRAEGIDTPALFLTARTLREDVLHGLTLGADDYMFKPFSMEELLLRIRAILRRLTRQELHKPDAYCLGEYTFDPLTRILSQGETEKKLTERESRLLQLLAEQVNQTLSRKKALMEIWGDDSYFNSRSMDVYINKLRKHLRADKNVQILTVHGSGFKLVNLG